MPLKQMTASREYKNNLFIYLFTKKKEYALSLYNAVNGSHYTNEEDIKFKLLEDVLFIEMKNDVSFIFDNTLSLYEHQSTFSHNMPLRGLFYLADLYRRLVPSDRLYRKKLIRIPTPKYIVFYNGPVEDMGVDRLELKLSDAFEVPDESKGFEWTATVININPGFNEKLFEKCTILREYTLFVEVVRRNAETMDMNEAMVKAIEECLNEGILKEFLQEYGKELEEMCWERYDTERILQIQHEEALEDAREEGLRLGLEEGRAEGRAEAEHTIFLLKQEIENLKRKACTFGQSVLE
ncbi:MAG: hypothetical protein E7284_09015 [Lachnospiraceae bacterium]|nr:hypothetical protein [Lachnospiraceae bacterium]